MFKLFHNRFLMRKCQKKQNLKAKLQEKNKIKKSKNKFLFILIGIVVLIQHGPLSKQIINLKLDFFFFYWLVSCLNFILTDRDLNYNSLLFL